MLERPDDRFKELLRARGVPPSLLELVERETQSGRPLRDALVWLGVLDDEGVAGILAEYYGVPYFDYFGRQDQVRESFARELAEQEGEQFIQRLEIIPIAKGETNGQRLAVVGFVDPDPKGGAVVNMTNVAKRWGCKLYPMAVSASAFYHFFFYTFSRLTISELRSSLKALEEKDEAVDETLAMLLAKAIYDGCSDIHLEPGDLTGRIRVRLDGSLSTLAVLSIEAYSRLVHRVKTLCTGIQASDRFRPQDGTLVDAEFGAELKKRYDISGVDFRVSIYPNTTANDDNASLSNESCVIRILNRRAGVPGLDQLGFNPRIVKVLKDVGQRATGIFIITGPTGSGKTTTLYSLMKEVNGAERAIITVEDPVEYRNPLWKQGQVREGHLTFQNALSSILRHDPDVILLGEIRDEETARYTIQAANTGHLVLTTLHTNDASLAILRLMDLGVEKFFIQNAVLGVLSQRLVRKPCSRCGEWMEVNEEEVDSMVKELKRTVPGADLEPFNITKELKGKGCPHCNYTGYKGRTVVAEYLPITPKVRNLIEREIFGAEMKEEMLTEFGTNLLILDALEKVKKGLTTLEEVRRRV